MTATDQTLNPSGYVIAGIAFIWSVFQLATASVLILDSLSIRAIHLAFAMLIVFLAYPGRVRKQARKDIGAISTVLNWTAALIGALAAIYIVLDFWGISGRQGVPLIRDLVIGVALILLVLEAARRAVGPALPIISAAFLAYALYGNYMPDFLSFKGVSLNRLLGQMTMSTEGIYGIPLDVSANIVFLFVLFGATLERAGAGQYFIELALSLLGRFRGGPAKAAVVASGMTGMISGSSIANVVTTGTFTIPLMKKVGYPAEKAGAIEVAAGIDGQIMPPIMGAAAFIMAEYINVPYVNIVRAAIIPALLSYCALFYITHVEACKLGLRGMDRSETPRFRDVFFRGVHYLIPIAILVVELIYFRHSPQMAVFRSIVTLWVIIVGHAVIAAARSGRSPTKGLIEGARTIVWSLVAGGRNMVSVAIATACAGIIVGVVTLGLGGIITEVIDQLSRGNIYVMLFITAVACLIIGMGIPTTATYIVVASLAAPAIVTLSDSSGFAVPLIAAHLFCFYFGILADDTPPVGLASFAAAAIAKSDPIVTGIQGFRYHIRTAILPFAFIFNHDLLLIGVDNVFRGLAVFAAGLVGVLAFVSATQGWFAVRNRWYEAPILLAVTVCMLRPDIPTRWMGSAGPLSSFAIGVTLYVALYFWQYRRTRS